MTLALSAVARFEAKYEPEPTTGCWLWTAALLKDGYGAFGFAGRSAMGAHRASYQLAYGPIPPGISVLHRCDTPACVRPDHLFLGTNKDNMEDMVRKGRKPSRAGELSWTARLTAEQVLDIKRRAGVTTQAALAREYGVHPTTVNNILSGKRWASVVPSKGVPQ